jgi:hypothetical protein
MKFIISGKLFDKNYFNNKLIEPVKLPRLNFHLKNVAFLFVGPKANLDRFLDAIRNGINCLSQLLGRSGSKSAFGYGEYSLF